MKTKLLKPTQLEEVISLLKKGEIVALPTETVYGLAADAKNNIAIEKIFIAKNRPKNHPLIVHINSLDRVKEWTNEIPSNAYRLAECFWPGPLTMLFNKNHNIRSVITGGSSKIALRVPNNFLMLEVIKRVGGALVAPSANTYTKLSPTRAEHVICDLNSKIAAVLDDGACSVGIESTIIDVTTNIPKILRPGSITKNMIENALQIKIEEYKKHTEQVPGNIYAHYQPNTPVFLMALSEIENYILKTDDNDIAIMHYSPLNSNNKVRLYQIPHDRSGYAKLMYDTLHKIDKNGFRKILIEKPPNSSNWSYINDRLNKAAAKYNGK